MKPLFTLILFVSYLTICKAQTIESSSHSTIGYIRSDGTIENSSHSTIGYAKNIKKEWAAVFFFFFKET